MIEKNRVSCIGPVKSTKHAPGVVGDMLSDEIGLCGNDVLGYFSREDLYLSRNVHVPDLGPKGVLRGSSLASISLALIGRINIDCVPISKLDRVLSFFLIAPKLLSTLVGTSNWCFFIASIS